MHGECLEYCPWARQLTFKPSRPQFINSADSCRRAARSSHDRSCQLHVNPLQRANLLSEQGRGTVSQAAHRLLTKRASPNLIGSTQHAQAALRLLSCEASGGSMQSQGCMEGLRHRPPKCLIHRDPAHSRNTKTRRKRGGAPTGVLTLQCGQHASMLWGNCRAGTSAGRGALLPQLHQLNSSTGALKGGQHMDAQRGANAWAMTPPGGSLDDYPQRSIQGCPQSTGKGAAAAPPPGSLQCVYSCHA